MWYMFCIKPQTKNPDSTGNSFPHVTATLPWPWTIQSSANLPFIVHVISFLDVILLLLLPSHFVIIPPLHKFDWPAIRVIILINAKRNVNLAIGCEIVWLQVKFVSFCGEQSYPVLDVCSRIAAYLPGHLTNLALELGGFRTAARTYADEDKSVAISHGWQGKQSILSKRSLRREKNTYRQREKTLRIANFILRFKCDATMWGWKMKPDVCTFRSHHHTLAFAAQFC